MKISRRTIGLLLFAAGLSTAGLTIWAIKSDQSPWRFSAPPALLSLEETAMKDFTVEDFDAAHSPLGIGKNEHLIFGNLPVAQPAVDLSPALACFLGRWEGFSYGPPVKKDWKYVLVIREISERGGTAFLWAGTNLQYPDQVKEIEFRVVPGKNPSIEWQFREGDRISVYSFTFNSGTGRLQGWLDAPQHDRAWGPIDLGREQSFRVYADYPGYLAELRIQPVAYSDDFLTRYYGKGFLLYLPDGYDKDPKKDWPLMVFFHGSGDRGENLYLLSKASPFLWIREKGPLPFLIVAPLLSASDYYYSFPENYMDGVMDQILADYRVDRKRIYATGLSIGGEATYRFALHRPDMLAAIAPLASYLDSLTGLEQIKDLPVWAIHGADDTVVPLSRAQKVVDALREAGGNVRFSILENHDHDVWTDTYLDPLFYEWLLSQRRP
jgi:predicted esterase